MLRVDEGAVLTSAGLAAGIDLCVQLVRSDYGSDAAVGVARRMVIAPHRVSDLSIEDVAVRSGLGTATNLRLRLTRDAGTTPTAYRGAYQGHQPVSQPVD